MSDYGLKISLPGYDVKTATPEQCAVHSSFSQLKAKIGQPSPHVALLDVDFTATVAQNVTHTVYTINHDYGYVPFNLSSIEFTDGLGTTVYGLGYAGVGVNLAINAYCTSTQFIVTIYDNFNWTNANARLKVSYYLFAENGS